MNILWDDSFNQSPHHDLGLQRYAGQYSQEDREAVQERMSAEHKWTLTDVDPQQDHGIHLSGSAVAYIGTVAPTKRPDSNVTLNALDTGRMWVNITTSQLYVWDGSAWLNFLTAEKLYVTDLDVSNSATIHNDLGVGDNITAIRATIPTINTTTIHTTDANVSDDLVVGDDVSIGGALIIQGKTMAPPGALYYEDTVLESTLFSTLSQYIPNTGNAVLCVLFYEEGIHTYGGSYMRRMSSTEIRTGDRGDGVDYHAVILSTGNTTLTNVTVVV